MEIIVRSYFVFTRTGIIRRVGIDLVELEFFNIVGGNIKWGRYFGK